MSPFQALNLPNGQTIGNRIAKAAMEENLADTEQAPSPALIRLYQAWADGESGLLLTGNVMIDRRAMTGPGGVALEDETEIVAAQFGQRLIVQVTGFLAVDLVATGGGVIEATEDVHQRRFTGAGSADDRDHFPGMDRQIDVVQREKFAVTGGETAGDAGEL